MFCHDQKQRLRMPGFQYGYSQYVNIAYSILSRAVRCKTTRILVLCVCDILAYVTQPPIKKNSLVDPILLGNDHLTWRRGGGYGFFLKKKSQVLVDRTQHPSFLHPTLPFFIFFFHFYGLEIFKIAIICRFLIA